MTGILLVTHANLGHTLIETTEFILGGKQDNLFAVSINIQDHPDSLRKKIKMLPENLQDALESLKKDSE